jgi:hypothetical protein
MRRAYLWIDYGSSLRELSPSEEDLLRPVLPDSDFFVTDDAGNGRPHSARELFDLVRGPIAAKELRGINRRIERRSAQQRAELEAQRRARERQSKAESRKRAQAARADCGAFRAAGIPDLVLDGLEFDEAPAMPYTSKAVPALLRAATCERGFDPMDTEGGLLLLQRGRDGRVLTGLARTARVA